MPIRDEAINVFMGLPGDGDRLELTYNHGVDSYELGTGYDHIAITVDDIDATLGELAEQGIEPEKPPYTSARGRVADLLRARPRRLPHRDRSRPTERRAQRVRRTVRAVVGVLPAASATASEQLRLQSGSGPAAPGDADRAAEKVSGEAEASAFDPVARNDGAQP